MDCTCAIRNLFAGHGLRCTQQRLWIYHALELSSDHPTADELHQRVSLTLPGISLATVYNTLEAFYQVGLVQKLPGAGCNGSSRYDAVRKNHLHLRCQKTGSVTDVPDELGQLILDHIPPQKLAELENRLDFKINQVQIELIGEHQNHQSDVMA